MPKTSEEKLPTSEKLPTKERIIESALQHARSCRFVKEGAKPQEMSESIKTDSSGNIVGFDVRFEGAIEGEHVEYTYVVKEGKASMCASYWDKDMGAYTGGESFVSVG